MDPSFPPAFAGAVAGMTMRGLSASKTPHWLKRCQGGWLLNSHPSESWDPPALKPVWNHYCLRSASASVVSFSDSCARSFSSSVVGSISIDTPAGWS